jgi:MYXO-CTERM domain-containing protein
MPRSPRLRPRFGLADRSASTGLDRVHAVIGGSILAASVLAVSVAAIVVTPRSAQHPQLVVGSMVLEDERPPVVLDVATGTPTIRLREVYEQVDATSYADVQLEPLDAGTLLVNRRTGAFNLLGRGHLAVKAEGGGVGLGEDDDVRSAEAVGARSGGYILQRSDTGTRISLVGRETVLAAAEVTAGGGGTVRPRGFAELDEVALDQPGAAVVAGDHLWVLVEEGSSVGIRRIGLPADGDRDLDVEDVGAVAAPAALAVVGSGDDASAALLSADGLAWLGGGSSTQPVEGPELDVVLPVEGDDHVARFLVRSGSGWHLVSGASSSGVPRRDVIRGLEAGSDLRPGASVRGATYTYEVRPQATGDDAAPGDPTTDEPGDDDGAPRLLRIRANGEAEPVPGMARYPRKARGEVAHFDDARVLVRAGRIVFNNPASVLAVMVFSDGADDPIVIDKSTAADVTTTGAVGTPGEEAETDAGPDDPAPEPAPEDEVAPDAAAEASTVSEEARCAESDQQPRVPVLKQPSMGIRSATLSWAYPLLDTADCHPSSFSITVRALDGPQPAQAFWEVVGQTSASVEGLRPATAYEFVVTAYLGERSTPSLPRTGSTLPTGPAAPSAVRVEADGRGQWVVTWDACAGAACDVPVGEWVVSGSSCGPGFVGSPPVVRVDGTSRRTAIDAAALGLLGKHLTFRVHGVGYDGLEGDPATAPSCVEAWRPPLADRLLLSASATPAGDDTVTAQLSLGVEGPDIEAFGSTRVSFTYEVEGRRVGPTKERTVTVTGLEPGRSYDQQVTVTPDDHPEAAVVVRGPRFSQTLPWPGMDLHASVAEVPLDPNRARLDVRVNRKPPVEVEAFGSLTCGSYQQPVSAVVPGFADRFSVDLDLVRTGGPCRIDVQLRERGTQRYGVPSPLLSAAFEAGRQPDPRSFRARWMNLREGHIEVTLDGQGKGVDWTLRVLPACGVEARLGSPPLLPVVLDANPCIDHPDHRDATFEVEVSWRYLGAVQRHVLAVSGRQPDPPPTTTTTTTTTTPTSSSTTTQPTSSSTTAQPTSTTSTNGAGGGSAPILGAGLLGLALAVAGRRRTLQEHP